MASANVRISPEAHTILQQLAKEEGKPMQSILDQALESYRREKFLRGANADYAALKKDPRAWKDELGDRKVWERALKDGIDKE
jgi:hypothetical protein